MQTFYNLNHFFNCLSFLWMLLDYSLHLIRLHFHFVDTSCFASSSCWINIYFHLPWVFKSYVEYSPKPTLLDVMAKVSSSQKENYLCRQLCGSWSNATISMLLIIHCTQPKKYSQTLHLVSFSAPLTQKLWSAFEHFKILH